MMSDVVTSHVPLVLHHLPALLALHLATLAVHVHDVLKGKKDQVETNIQNKQNYDDG